MVGFSSGHHRVSKQGFYRDSGLDFRARLVVGDAAHGASDIGEVLATIGRVGGQRGWAREWSATARRVQGDAQAARDAGHLVSASAGFLRAATYWACAVDGLAGTSKAADLLAAFRAHRQCWDAVVDCSDGAHVRVDVPYEGTTLPGYLLRPDASGAARPTLVMTNGSDGAVTSLWTTAAAAALARGWNAFAYDGPGQQSMLFEHDMPFRPDWEAVLTPVLDALSDRPDVAADRMAGYGISQGGFWLPRALAYENRLVGAVIDPGVVDVSTTWTTQLTKGMLGLLDTGDRAGFNRNMQRAMRLPSIRRKLTLRARPFRQNDWFDLYKTVQNYRLDEPTAALITTPLLITDPEQEQFWPGQSRQLADMVSGPAQVVRFTANEGANFHCQPLARLQIEPRLFDWLAPLMK